MEKTKCASVAIMTGAPTILDHLGVLSAIQGIPLIVNSHETYAFAKRYYPMLNTAYKDPIDLSLSYLADNFEVIFQTGKYWAMELMPMLKLLYRKKIRIIYCPHGNSDKGHSLTKIEQHPPQDVHLIYGDHMLDHLNKTHYIEKIDKTIRTGNYRLPFYLEHQEFFDQITIKEVFDQFDKKRPTILYAPTWPNQENSTTFFQEGCDLIEQTDSDFNLIVKLHPFLERYYPAETWHIVEKYQDKKNVLFLHDFPLIYSLLNHCDLYVGDFSSIGYDCLVLDKPLFFLKQPNQESLIASCGMAIPESTHALNFITKNLNENRLGYQLKRQAVARYVFGDTVAPEILNQQIQNLLE